MFKTSGITPQTKYKHCVAWVFFLFLCCCLVFCFFFFWLKLWNHSIVFGAQKVDTGIYDLELQGVKRKTTGKRKFFFWNFKYRNYSFVFSYTLENVFVFWLWKHSVITEYAAKCMLVEELKEQEGACVLYC